MATVTTGVMLIGLDGAIGSTVVAGTELMVRSLAPRIGMITETGRLPPKDGAPGGRAGRPLLADALGLARLEDLRFGGWDMRAESVREAVARERIVRQEISGQVAERLEATRPSPAVFCEGGAPACGHRRRSFRTLRDGVDAIRRDIDTFRSTNGAGEVVLVDISPTAPLPPDSDAHRDLDRLERALDGRDPAITANMLYLYAAIQEHCAYVNFTPNPTEVPALATLARERRVPFAGRDGKTGQTLLKTALAPALRERHLRVRGWFSHNMLGNGDGKALANADACATKILSKEGVLDEILGYPLVTDEGEPTHVVTIHYYPPRGDAKESWDNVDLEGFLGESMQLKLNFLCKDSILAAPVVLDLVRLTADSLCRGEAGALDHLSLFFKSPLPGKNGAAPHDFFAQVRRFERHVLEQAERG